VAVKVPDERTGRALGRVQFSDGEKGWTHRFCKGTHNVRIHRHRKRPTNQSSSESNLDEPTPAGHAGDEEMLLDAERAGVLLVGAYRRSKTRPPRAQEMQVVKNIEEWLCEREAWNLRFKCPTLLYHQVRELYRATNSRAARKAMKAKYILNDAQWDSLTTEWADYLTSQGVLQRLSTWRLNMLDKLADSRLARSLLRARGPVPAFWWRAAQRQSRALESDKFGNKEIYGSEGLTYREYRNAARHKWLADQRSVLLKKYRQYSLQSFLELSGGFASRSTQPLRMSAMEYFELAELDLRAYHADIMTWLRVTSRQHVAYSRGVSHPRTSSAVEPLSVGHPLCGTGRDRACCRQAHGERDGHAL
jgi:hypothetical protein